MTRTIPRLVAAAMMMWPAHAGAQVFGTFTWQMEPYCNRVTLTLTNTPAGFALSGFDDQCGATGRAGAVGAAAPNLDGTIGLSFTIVAPPVGEAVHVSARVSPVTGQGTWSDDVGNAGSFGFGGNTPGLPVRPSNMAPLDVADNPNEPANPCGVIDSPTLVLCGTSTLHWRTGGFGIPGLQVWRDRDGRAHIRGSATRSSGTVGGAVFRLPPSLVPTRTLAMTVSTGQSAGVHQGGTALLVIYGPDVPSSTGYVAVYSPSTANHPVLHIGEVVFTVDR